MSQGTFDDSRTSRVLKLYAALGTEPISALMALLYCCTLCNLLFLDYVNGDLALIGFNSQQRVNMNIQLPLFWSTWRRARGLDPATYDGLAHGRD